MPTTVEGLLLALLFVAPGLLFELGLERRLPYWRTPVADRVLRFFATSLLLHLLAAWPTYRLWHAYFSSANTLRAHRNLPWPLWVAAAAYLLVPFVLGYILGGLVRKGARLTSLVIGMDPAPKAWDAVFGPRDRAGYVRVRFTSGTWMGGIWGSDLGPNGSAFASSFPATEDFYLPISVLVNASTGELVLDDQGQAQTRYWGLLIERSKIDVLEFQAFPPQPEESSP